MIFDEIDQSQRLKWAFASCKNGAWGEEPDGEYDAVCIRAADFDSQLGRLNNGERTLRSLDQKTFDRISLRKGDIIIEKSGGGEKQLVGRAVLFQGSEPSFTSNFLARCRPAEGVVPSFLNYLMLAIYNGRGTYPHIKQSTGIQNLDLASFLDIKVKIPSLETQRFIAQFLDEKTARIDGLIDKKRALLDRLTEKRQALITRAVTKGLNPDAPMKPSGIDWLGDIPEHWEALRLKNIAKRIVDAEHKTAPSVDTGDYFLVRTSNVRDGQLVRENAKYVDYETYLEWTRRCVPEANDLLLTREAPAGEVCLVPDDLPVCLGQRMVLIKTDRERVLPEYLVQTLAGGIMDEFIASLSQGSTVTHFNMSDIGCIPLLLPPLNEQRKIAVELENSLGQVAVIKARVGQSIDTLEEYRSALITAAVTGQIGELQ